MMILRRSNKKIEDLENRIYELEKIIDKFVEILGFRRIGRNFYNIENHTIVNNDGFESKDPYP